MRGVPRLRCRFTSGTGVDAGLFHDFHQSWAVALRGSLNASRLPPDYLALADQDSREPIPDLLTLASCDAGPECVAYVEPIGVGDSLREMPLFLPRLLRACSAGRDVSDCLSHVP